MTMIDVHGHTTPSSCERIHAATSSSDTNLIIQVAFGWDLTLTNGHQSINQLINQPSLALRPSPRLSGAYKKTKEKSVSIYNVYYTYMTI